MVFFIIILFWLKINIEYINVRQKKNHKKNGRQPIRSAHLPGRPLKDTLNLCSVCEEDEEKLVI